MARSLEKNYRSRWSEPILQHKNQQNIIQTLHNDVISSVERSRSKSPQYNGKKKFPNTINNELDGRRMPLCVSHKSECNKIVTNTNSETQCLRESIELQLISGQLNESLADDRQATLIQHLDLITTTLDALIHHLQSLELSHQSCCRVLDFGQQIIDFSSMAANFSTTSSKKFTHTLNEIKCDRDERVQQLTEIVNVCTINMSSFNDRLRLLINNYKLKRDDFSVATKNFQCLLNNTKLNYPQLEKLCRQYDSILRDYQCKRYEVNLELPRIIQMRLDTLQKGFQLINELYRNHEYSQNIGNIFKLIHDFFVDYNSKNIVQKETLQSSPEKLCQRCKINRVERK